MKNVGNKLIVWIAQGFGIGRIPFAPGTWGSLLGVLLTLPLMFVSPGIYLATAVISTVVAIWVCGEAEKSLGKDPPSVVLDEIVAIPWCLIGAWFSFNRLWEVPKGMTAQFAVGGLLLVSFLLFRLFDIWKPWPIRQSQRLPGGWGVVIDDVLAAAYVNLVMLAVCFFFR